MKNIILGLAFSGMLALAPTAHAQSSTSDPIGYSERVPETDHDRSSIYRSALGWTENHFSYTPKKALRTDAGTGEIKLQGTAQVKTVSPAGQQQERPVTFEFVFHALPTGYDYSVGSFRLAPDVEKPEETITLEEFVTLLSMDKSNARTHNDRRVVAQANSLASEIAMAFRSYMNSRPAAGAVE